MNLPSENLHIFIHHLKRAANFNKSVADKKVLNPIRLSPTDLNEPFAIQFDVARRRLEELPGGYCEPDGAWGWNSADGRTRVGGTLHAIDERLISVESFGRFSPQAWQEFLQLLDLPASQTVVQLVERGQFVCATEMPLVFERSPG